MLSIAQLFIFLGFYVLFLHKSPVSIRLSLIFRGVGQL